MYFGQIQPPELCNIVLKMQDVMESTPEFNPSHQICAIHSGKNSCNGDSGGPVMISLAGFIYQVYKNINFFYNNEKDYYLIFSAEKIFKVLVIYTV